MSEPEELILEGAHFATRVARDLWRRHARPGDGRAITLDTIRSRLEWFVSALLSVSVPIAPIQPPPPATFLSRLAGGSRSRRQPALGATDGRRVFLCPVLDMGATPEETVAIYRLLAVQQAVRMLRASHRTLRRIQDPRARDLFMLAEAAAVDRWVALNTPGLIDVLATVRSQALTAWEPHARHTDPVAETVRHLLCSDVRSRALNLSDAATADDCAGWATAESARCSPAAYRPVALPSYWGEFIETLDADASTWNAAPGTAPERAGRPRVVEMRRRPQRRQAAEGEDDRRPGPWVIRADEPQESVEDPFGLQRPGDRDSRADAAGLGDSLSDLPEARVVRTPEPPREVLRSGDREDNLQRPQPATSADARGISYPEWDHRTSRYQHPGAIVREPEPALDESSWASATLSRHATLVRRLRTQFERLRRRRVHLFRQIDGLDVDVSEYITEAADRRAGLATEGRLYVNSRTARRDLAVALLLDISASTDAWVGDTRRIIDVEKEAMLVVCQALDVLGDPYALYAFCGDGPGDVRVLPLKRFAEPSNVQLRRRLAAVDSDGYTRLGAALRHVTATLCHQSAAMRLLLLLSDGKPNDVDVYEGRYGIEDTRQAVAEAHRQGVTVFCLTVDREAPLYASRIFGRSGFTVLHRAEQLPAVVVEVLRQLITR